MSSFVGGRKGVTIDTSAGSAVVSEEDLAAERGLVIGWGGDRVLIFLITDPVQGEAYSIGGGGQGRSEKREVVSRHLSCCTMGGYTMVRGVDLSGINR